MTAKKRKTSENNRKFKGVWIPAEYWLDENLTIMEVVILTEIDSLDGENGCFASNKHFASFIGMTPAYVSKIIKHLKEKGYISVKYKTENRVTTRSIKIIRGINSSKRGINNSLGGINSSKRGINNSLGGINSSKRGINNSLGGINSSKRGINNSLGGINSSKRGINNSLGGINSSKRGINNSLDPINYSVPSNTSSNTSNSNTISNSSSGRRREEDPEREQIYKQFFQIARMNDGMKDKTTTPTYDEIKQLRSLLYRINIDTLNAVVRKFETKMQWNMLNDPFAYLLKMLRDGLANDKYFEG
ncbi:MULTISPECIES: helix-turn-helix domain-containing protein [unclassified Lactobacillus]|uniref:helix-turn-helix domain-containing protein n=1 Tax=unclassified Lactobacillus TaxID=2620435 RepID=UPI001E2C4AA6|nr:MULTISPECIES: helix-turn-helix domain-containing protein [unclassified Lactobacillus]